MYVGIYYDLRFGYIIVSGVMAEDIDAWLAMEPAITKSCEVTSMELGEEIEESLLKSKNAPMLKGSKLPEYEYWHVSGIKDFVAFGRKFQGVRIKGEDGVLKVVKMVKGKSGIFIYPKPEENKEIQLRLDTPAEELGRIVKDLFSEETGSNIKNDNASFITQSENKVTYKYPSESFEDIGDGGGDMHQAFVYEGDEDSYLAFLDTGKCTGLTRDEIEAYWEEAYGKLEEFDYEEKFGNVVKGVITRRTKKSKLIANLYQDGDFIMEVIAVINRSLDYEKQIEIEKDLKQVMDSITVTENKV